MLPVLSMTPAKTTKEELDAVEADVSIRQIGRK